MAITQLSLFNTNNEDTQHQGLKDAMCPIEAFERWMNSQRPALRASSQKIYRWLWAKFIRDISQQGIKLELIEPTDITNFLNGLDIKRPQRERYQQVIIRAFNDLTHVLPAKPISKHLIDDPYRRSWRNAPSNDPTQFLTLTEQLRLLEAINHSYHILKQLNLHQLSFKQWKQWRDISIVTILISCGLTAAELTVLSVSCISLRNERPHLDVGAYQGITSFDRRSRARDPHKDATHAWQGDQAGAQREVPIPNWAYPIIKSWIAIRELDLSDVSSDRSQIRRLFPGSRQPSAARPNSLMNMATLARIVTNWGKRNANLTLTAQRLRNTYGARLVEENDDLNLIEQRMGYAPGAASAFRLRTSWLAFKNKRANLDAGEAANDLKLDQS